MSSTDGNGDVTVGGDANNMSGRIDIGNNILSIEDDLRVTSTGRIDIGNEGVLRLERTFENDGNLNAEEGGGE